MARVKINNAVMPAFVFLRLSLFLFRFDDEFEMPLRFMRVY